MDAGVRRQRPFFSQVSLSHWQSSGGMSLGMNEPGNSNAIGERRMFAVFGLF